MLDTSFSIVDYSVFGFLLTTSSLIGVYFWWKSRKNVSNSEFLTGKRKLQMFPVTLSLMASFLSTNTLLGVPAEIFQMGTQFSVHFVSFIIAVVLAAEIFLPIYYRLEMTSVNQYLEQRFGGKSIRYVGTIGFLLSTTPYMAVVLYGPALALSSVTPLSITTSILGVGIVCTLYTAIGGIKAVIWTDVLQFMLMFLGVLMVIIQGSVEVGGLQNMWDINEKGGRVKFLNFSVDLYNNDNVWNVIIGTTIIWTANYCVMQTQIQRYCSLGSEKKARRTLYCNLPGLIVLSIMAVMCGMALFSKYGACDPVTLRIIERHDQLMPYFVMDTLGTYPGLPGLFVACVFSGSLSTLSSGFNALAAVTWEDLVKHRIKVKDDEHALSITKLIAILYGLLAILMSFAVGNAGTVLQASISLVGAMVGPLFAIFTLGIAYPFATELATILGFVSGISVSLFLSIGSMLISRPKISLPTSLNDCPIDVLREVFSRYNSFPNSSYISSYEPIGLAKVFHISYLLHPIFGFIVCITVGVLLSHCIGKPNRQLDPKLLTPLAIYLFGIPNKIDSMGKYSIAAQSNEELYKEETV